LRIEVSPLLLVSVAIAIGPACGSKAPATAFLGSGAGGAGGADGGADAAGAPGAAGAPVDAGDAAPGDAAPSHPSQLGGRWVGMISPTVAETFQAPSTLRLIAAAHDDQVATNVPVEGRGGNASRVQFFVDGTSVLQVDGADAEYWIFKGTVGGVGAGTHRVWARATYVEPDLVLDTAPVMVTVAAPPAGTPTVTLDADVVLAGAQGFELVGAPGARVRLVGNGHRIISDGEPTGPLTLKYVDVVDLGNRVDTTQPSIEITISGPVTIEDSTFDGSDALDIGVRGDAAASIRRNLFRSNMRMPLGQSPSSSGTSPSYPTIRFTGASTGAKVFAGNNVAAGWVQFDKTSGWLVGGDADADANVIIGPRGGIFAQESAAMQVRNNYSHHNYWGGWSQGSNFELGGSTDAVVEHNVICGGSWPVRGAAGEFRYNLVSDGGHQQIWPETGGSIHHNVFVGGQSDVASVFVQASVGGAKVFNNTVDGQLDEDMVTAVSVASGAMLTLSSNAFINVPRPPGMATGATVTLEGGGLTADYNAFAGLQSVTYSDARRPAHDVVLAGGAAAMLTDPPITSCDWDDAALWTRAMTVRQLLAQYRHRYTPAAGSPLIDKGDPAGGTGNDIGAVGAGAPNAADKFGAF
jgi:hypothetical protein